MHRMNTADLRELEVINLCGGERLGYPCDFEIDIADARILSIIVEKNDGRFTFFSGKEQYVIPWCYIECIGEDAILVKLDNAKLGECFCVDRRKKRQKCK